jgi:hypothetical protein
MKTDWPQQPRHANALAIHPPTSATKSPHAVQHQPCSGMMKAGAARLMRGHRSAGDAIGLQHETGLLRDSSSMASSCSKLHPTQTTQRCASHRPPHIYTNETTQQLAEHLWLCRALAMNVRGRHAFSGSPCSLGHKARKAAAQLGAVHSTSTC